MFTLLCGADRRTGAKSQFSWSGITVSNRLFWSPDNCNEQSLSDSCPPPKRRHWQDDKVFLMLSHEWTRGGNCALKEFYTRGNWQLWPFPDSDMAEQLLITIDRRFCWRNQSCLITLKAPWTWKSNKRRHQQEELRRMVSLSIKRLRSVSHK